VELISFKIQNGDLIVTEAEGILNNDNDSTIPTTAAVIDYFTANDGGIDNVVEDTSPELGGDLNAQGFNISNFTTLMGKNNGSSTLRTGQAASDALYLQAYDVDGGTFTTFGLLISGDNPTFDLSDSVTKEGQYIYRGGGTDIPLIDGGTGASDAPGARTNLGLAIGTNVQAYDATLQGIASLSPVANQLIYSTGADTFSTTSLTAFARTFLDDADAGKVRETLGIQIGMDVQPYDLELAAIAGLTSAADKGIQFTGAGTAATYDLTTAGKALLDDADAAAQRATLGLVIGTNVQAYNANTAFRTDKLSVFAATTSSELASVISDETGTGALVFANGPVVNLDTTSTINSNYIYRATGTDVPITDGGTGASDASGARTNLGLGTIATQNSNSVTITGGSITAITDLALADGGTGTSLVDPNADRIMFWDDSAGVVTWLTPGNGLTITGTTLGFTSGTYTPTYTNVANVASFGTVSDLSYYRVGDMVTVFGRVSIDPTSASVDTEFRGTLPIASNFGLFTDCAGACISLTSVSLCAGVRADTTNDQFTVKYINTAETAAKDFALHFSYRVI